MTSTKHPSYNGPKIKKRVNKVLFLSLKDHYHETEEGLSHPSSAHGQIVQNKSKYLLTTSARSPKLGGEIPYWHVLFKSVIMSPLSVSVELVADHSKVQIGTNDGRCQKSRMKEYKANPTPESSSGHRGDNSHHRASE